MKKVAIIGTRGYPSFYGGFETAVRKLAPYLADKGWQVTVYGRKGSVSSTAAGGNPLIQSVQTPGLNTQSLSTLTYGLTATISAMIRKPDVALVMNVANGFWLPLLRLRGVPVVVNVDGIEWERDKWSPLAKKVFRLGAWMTSKWATSIVCDAIEIQRIWSEKYAVEGHFIPYGGEDSKPVRLEDGLVSGEYILMVARFVPANTVQEFFGAATSLAKNWNVVVVGSSGFGGDFDLQAQALADTNPRIMWLGHLSDDERLFSLWQNAGVYFHGHSVGGTNPALVQAMACGAPTVARDTPYNREVLGEHGVFTTPEVASIVANISALMSAPEQRAEMSKGVTERARTLYNWPLVCNLYEELMSSTTAKRATEPVLSRTR